MSDALRALYQEVILDHYKRPRNWGRLPQPTGHADGHNPLCGDRLSVDVQVAGNRVADIRVEGQGCAISVASASMMSEALKGRTVDEAAALFDRFHDVVTGRADAEAALLGKLAVFAGVAEFPARVKCATLAWHTLRAALDARSGAISTE